MASRRWLKCHDLSAETLSDYLFNKSRLRNTLRNTVICPDTTTVRGIYYGFINPDCISVAWHDKSSRSHGVSDGVLSSYDALYVCVLCAPGCNACRYTRHCTTLILGKMRLCMCYFTCLPPLVFPISEYTWSTEVTHLRAWLLMIGPSGKCSWKKH